MIYGFWDMARERHNFLSFWTVFCPFTPPMHQNPKFWRNEKNTWRCYHFINEYHKWQLYDIWFPRYRVQWTKFFVISDHFLPFYSPKILKNQYFEKMRKLPGDIIILHICTINDNHMMYGSWDMECDGQNFLSFCAIFGSFTPLTTRTIKISKNWKKHLEILPFYTCVSKIMIRWRTVPEIWCATDGRMDGKSDI